MASRCSTSLRRDYAQLNKHWGIERGSPSQARFPARRTNLENINTRTIGPKSDSAYDFSLPLNDDELKTLTEIVDER